MPINVRLPDDLRDRIDAARPSTVSREAWVRAACEVVLADDRLPDGSYADAERRDAALVAARSAMRGSPSPSLDRFK